MAKSLPSTPNLEHLKKQAKQFWDFLAGVQEVRRGVQHARHQSAE